MEERYKNMAKAIVIALLIILAILVLPMMFTSCHTNKSVSQEVNMQHYAQTVADSTTETAARTQWLSDLHLDLDSFELMIIPAPEIPALDDSCTLLDLTSRRPHPQANVVVLRGKHAVIGRADYVERDLNGRTQQHTASSDSTAVMTQEHKDIDTTAVAKPPNMNWILPLAIVIAAAALLFYGYYKYLKK